MDGLFNGPAGDRRRFLDRAVMAIDRRHGTRVNAFERAVRGRNRLLSERGFNRTWADAMENEIAELGVAIEDMEIELPTLDQLYSHYRDEGSLQ